MTILVSHQAVPPAFHNKIAPMLVPQALCSIEFLAHITFTYIGSTHGWRNFFKVGATSARQKTIENVCRLNWQL